MSIIETGQTPNEDKYIAKSIISGNELIDTLSTKANTIDVNNYLSAKVDKVSGKTLSTNDLTNTLKSNYDSAYTNTHAHSNKALIDSLISSGNGNYYLTNDGTYKSAGMIINALGSTSSDQTLIANQITTASFNGNPTITLPAISDNTKEAKVILDFTTTTTSYPLINTTGITLKKRDGKSFTYSNLSGVKNRLIFTTVDSGYYWEVELQIYGGVQTTFVRPNLTANGTLGGSYFAVAASSENGTAYAWRAVDGDTSISAIWEGTAVASSYIIYNPIPLFINSFNITNYNNGDVYRYVPTAGNVYGSDDNVTYTYLSPYTNSNIGQNATWNIPIAESNRGFYKYYKITISSTYGGDMPIINEIYPNGYYIAT